MFKAAFSLTAGVLLAIVVVIVLVVVTFTLGATAIHVGGWLLEWAKNIGQRREGRRLAIEYMRLQQDEPPHEPGKLYPPLRPLPEDHNRRFRSLNGHGRGAYHGKLAKLRAKAKKEVA